jgi:hypothetical protein
MKSVLRTRIKMRLIFYVCALKCRLECGPHFVDALIGFGIVNK